CAFLLIPLFARTTQNCVDAPRLLTTTTPHPHTPPHVFPTNARPPPKKITPTPPRPTLAYAAASMGSEAARPISSPMARKAARPCCICAQLIPPGHRTSRSTAVSRPPPV